jgi:hypothetical protein
MTISKKEVELRKHALSLVGTSVDDLQSSLPYFVSTSPNGLRVIEFALAICQRRGEKTKALVLGRKLRKLKKEIDAARKLRLTQQAYD